MLWLTMREVTKYVVKNWRNSDLTNAFWHKMTVRFQGNYTVAVIL